MFEIFKSRFAEELIRTNIPQEYMDDVMRCLDFAAVDFTFAGKKADIVEYSNPNQQILEYYLASKTVEGLSKKTIRAKQIVVGNFFNVIVKPYDQISTLEIRAYLYQYQKDRNISNRSLDAIRSHIRAFFEWCVNENMMKSSPAASIPVIKCEKKERKTLTSRELEYLRRACHNVREKAIVELLFSTGCRVSELTELTKEYIDYDNSTINVLGKGNKRRLCYLNDRALLLLKEYIESRGDDGCEYALASERWYNGKHVKMTSSTVERLLVKIANRSRKIGRITPHILRHTCATIALHRGMPINEVSMMLGHARLETTMIYAKTDREAVKADHKRCVN